MLSGSIWMFEETCIVMYCRLKVRTEPWFMDARIVIHVQIEYRQVAIMKIGVSCRSRHHLNGAAALGNGQPSVVFVAAGLWKEAVFCVVRIHLALTIAKP